MEKIELKFGAPVLLEWEDSHENPGWTFREPDEVGTVRTLGFVVANSDNTLAVSSTLSIARRGANLGSVSIPWSAIVKVVLLMEDQKLLEARI